MALPSGIRGVLIDVDGTLLVHDAAVPGVAGMLARLRKSGLSVRVTTNTTRRPRVDVSRALARAGIAVTEDEIVVPASIARRRILGSGRTRAALFVADGCRADFEGVEPDTEAPDWVVMGDLGAGYTWEVLNTAFRCVARGAPLLALHKNRSWLSAPDQLVLDAGPFVAAVEYASGVTAEIVGKPSRTFFELAIAELALEPREVLVVGDDVETDGAGGRAAGCRVALVRTGKLGRGSLPVLDVGPDLILDSAADLI